ncbi:MAG TPA: SLC13 family permease [Acidimicrobiales bacterium]|nr:SLC13 family permease [Acidimicrobiales bacterium]
MSATGGQAGARASAGRATWALAAAGCLAAGAAALTDPGDARAAVAQDWPPFVLVAGLLLIGLTADDDGVFAWAGGRLARLAPTGSALFVGAAILVAAVTAVLNLDTSVAFLTPVLVYAARRGGSQGALLYGCILLSNAASLLLPGSNLTNLIVLGHLHLSGGRFFVRMAPAWAAAVVVTAVVVAVGQRRSDRVGGLAAGDARRSVAGLGLAGVVAASALVVVLRSPALPVAAVAVFVVGVRIVTGRQRIERVVGVLGLPVLVGLLGVAVGLGTAGRVWSAPAQLMAHCDAWATAAIAAVASVAVNNLPAASLLAARVPAHPLALLVGLDVGPNLFVTGSLAWVLWLRTARSVGARPSLVTALRLGAVAAPLAMAAALAVLALGSAR